MKSSFETVSKFRVNFIKKCLSQLCLIGLGLSACAEPEEVENTSAQEEMEVRDFCAISEMHTESQTYQAVCNQDGSTSFCDWIILCDNGQIILFNERASEEKARGTYTLAQDKLRYTDETLISRSLEYDCKLNEILDPAVLVGGKYVPVDASSMAARCD